MKHYIEKRDEKGFTLIELLIAIVVVGILAAVAIVGIAGFGLSGRTTTSFNLLAACATLPWLVLAVWRPPYDMPLYKNYDPFLWPPQRSPVVDFLEREVALFPGKPFRGRVANLAGSSFELQYSYAPFLSQHDYDAMLLFFAANEHAVRFFAAGTEDGSADGEDAREHGTIELDGAVLHESAKAITKADELKAVLGHAGPNDRADHGVQAGAVTASGQDPYSHGFSLQRFTRPVTLVP